VVDIVSFERVEVSVPGPRRDPFNDYPSARHSRANGAPCTEENAELALEMFNEPQQFIYGLE
jgi:hypothetical protein